MVVGRLAGLLSGRAVNDHITKRMHLLDLVFIPNVRPRSVVSQSLRAHKLVIARGCRDDISLPRNLSCKACDWSCHLVYLAEDDHPGETRMGITRYGWVVEEDTCNGR